MSEPHPPSVSPSPLAGLLFLLPIPFVIIADTYLNAAFGLDDMWAGYLFITIWLAAETRHPGSFVPCAAGSLTGVALALLLQVVPPVYGMAGTIAVIALIVLFIYLMTIGRAKTIANFATMSFLSVCTAQQIQTHTPIWRVLGSTAVGIAYFGVLILGQRLIQGWMARRRARTAA